MKEIYVVIVFEQCEISPNGMEMDFGVMRTPGWFRDLNAAVWCVEHNEGDLWETIFNYAVIEKVSEGLYPDTFLDENRMWYLYDKSSKTYRRIPKPDKMKNGYILSIG